MVPGWDGIHSLLKSVADPASAVEQAHKQVMEELRGVTGVSLMFDLWMSRNGESPCMYVTSCSSFLPLSTTNPWLLMCRAIF